MNILIKKLTTFKIKYKKLALKETSSLITKINNNNLLVQTNLRVNNKIFIKTKSKILFKLPQLLEINKAKEIKKKVLNYLTG